MNKTDKIITHIEDHIAFVTLNRPDVHNAFDADMIAMLHDSYQSLSGNDDVIAIVLRGNGKSFSAGADLHWMKESIDFSEAQNEDDAVKLAKMLRSIYNCPKATIACIQGAAMGGGMGLAACHDIVIAQDTAIFALSEVKLGLIPATIAPYVIRAIGARHAKRFAQTGERFAAAKAYDIGLVHEVAANAKDMDEKLQTLIKTLRQNGMNAMRESKQLVSDYAYAPLDDDTLQDSARRIAKIRTTDEAQTRLKKFLEKK